MKRVRVLSALLLSVLGSVAVGCQLQPPAAPGAQAPTMAQQVRDWTTPPPPGHDMLSRRDKLLVDDADEQGFWDQFADDQDGMFDTSEWLASKTGFLPIVSPITEPAVGLGLLGTLAFFHDGDGEASRFAPPKPGQRKSAPNVAAIGGLLTENGTWGAFAGYLGNWRNDTIRYAGGLGYLSVNYDHYGIASELTGRPIDLNIEGKGTVQDVSFRVGESDFFVGARYQYVDSKVKGQRLLDLPGARPLEFNSQNAALGLTLTYDTRDNMFSPTRGVRAQATYNVFDRDLGGDFDYRELEVYCLAWWQVASRLNVGLRLEGKFVEGDVPFYARPFVNLRGVPAMRYQGDDVLVAETELRYDLTPRWSLVGFTGVGRASRTLERLFERGDERSVVDTAWNVGIGFRYLVARALGLRMGIDIACGPEDWALYITTGSAWQRL